MRRSAVAALFVLSAAAFLASPSPQYAAEADCGANDGNKCWQNESCANIIFFSICTTHYKYYPDGDGDDELDDLDVV